MDNLHPLFRQLCSAVMPKRTPVKKSRGKRRGPWRSPVYRKWVASQPCFLCGGASQCAHVTHGGMAQKGPDNETVPACPRHHDQIDGRAKLPGYRGLGKDAFEAFYKVNLLEIAQAYWQRYQIEKGKKESEAA